MNIQATKQSKPGPRAAADESPLDLSMLPVKRDWRRFKAFCETFLTHPDGSPITLKPFQAEFSRNLFPTSVGNRPAMALWSVPRGQGKTEIAAWLAVYALFADGVQAPEVLCIASSLEQATRQVFRRVVGLIQRNPELARRARISRESISTPWNSGNLYALPATEAGLQGWAHSFAVLDELHVVDAVVWESVVTGSLKREGSLTVAISTPPRNPDSVMKVLADDARENADANFYFREFTSDPSHEPLCEHCIKQSRPLTGGSKKQITSLASLLRKTPESVFRRLMLGQWGVAESDAWFTNVDMEAVKSPRRIEKGERVTIGVDGSWNGDSTAIVLATIEQNPHIEILKLWTPEGDTIPISEVEDAILKASKVYDVVEVIFDPFRWQRSIDALTNKGLTVSEMPNTIQRMMPALTGFHTAVMDSTVTINDEPILREHFLNARIKDTDRGITISKPSKDSAHKIDAAIAAVMAFSRATHYTNKKKAPSRAATFRYV